MRFGADLNAYTTSTRPSTSSRSRPTTPQFIGKGLDILRDWAGDVTLRPGRGRQGARRRPRGVAARPRRRHAAVRQAGAGAVRGLALRRSASRSAMPEIIKNAPRDTLYRFYKDWYRPDLMAVIAVGDFDPARRSRSEIKARFGDLTNAGEGARAAARRRAAGRRHARLDRDRQGGDRRRVVSVYNLVAAPRRARASRLSPRCVAEQLYSTILNERLAYARAASPTRRSSARSAASAPIARDDRRASRASREVKARQGRGRAARAVHRGAARRAPRLHAERARARAREHRARGSRRRPSTEATRDSREFTDEITRNFFAARAHDRPRRPRRELDARVPADDHARRAERAREERSAAPRTA